MTELLISLVADAIGAYVTHLIVSWLRNLLNKSSIITQT